MKFFSKNIDLYIYFVYSILSVFYSIKYTEAG